MNATVTDKQIRDIAEGMVDKTNDCDSNYDAIEEVSALLKETLRKSGVPIEEKKCKCNNCGCGKE